MWSHNCFSRGAPWDNPSKYFANDKNCSRTALVIWTLDDWGKIIRKKKDKEKILFFKIITTKLWRVFSPGSWLLNACSLACFDVIEYEGNLYFLIKLMVSLMAILKYSSIILFFGILLSWFCFHFIRNQSGSYILQHNSLRNSPEVLLFLN